MNNAQLINQDSGNTEYYTPQWVMDIIHKADPHIDLDPASCYLANRTVRAERYFTRDDDGLSRPWECDVLWMNHPFGRYTNNLWVDKLIHEFRAGSIAKRAYCITFANTATAWFQKLAGYHQLFLNQRVNYIGGRSTATKDSVITLFCRSAKEYQRFYEVSRGHGVLHTPYVPF